MRLVLNSSVPSIALLAVLLGSVGIAVIHCIPQRNSQAQRKGAVIQLDRNGDLQQALNRARPGDTIILQAGASYKGPFVLPAKPGSEFITIQTSAVAQLPEGIRVSPSQGAIFARLQSAQNGDPVIMTQPRAHHYRFIGIEIATTTPHIIVHDLVRLGDSGTQDTLEVVPHDLVIDRSYIHGHETQEVQRGISLNSSDTAITNSYISDIHGKGYDTQAICGWNGPGHYKILNNYLEGAGENVMFGGADPKIRGLVPSDIEIRGNYFFKPLKWKEGDPSYGGIHWSVKNLFELKNARRVTIDRNIFENNWVDAQAGPGILFTVRNQEGTAPWSTIEDVSFTNNVVKNSPAALNLLGKDNVQSSQRARGLIIANNLFMNIRGTFLTMTGYENVTIANNTHLQSGNIMSLYGEPSNGFIYQFNITVRESLGYGVKGDSTGEGTIALETFAPGYRFVKNVIVGANAAQYPANNFFPVSPANVRFASYNSGDFQLASDSPFIQAGDDKNPLGADFSKLPKV